MLSTVALAQHRPTVFVIDDLHWADRLSLDLFEHLAFTVADTAMREAVPLLLVGCYRTIDAGDRLSRLAARLTREEMCRTLPLSGLSDAETQDLIAALGVARPSHPLSATVSEAPRATRSSSRKCCITWSSGPRSTSRAGTSSRRRILTLASFLGDRFSVDLLGAVSGVAEDELLDLLDDAGRQRLVRSEGEMFEFAHPLIRHVFYHEPSAARRERIHRQTADTLERRHGRDDDTHLLEITHHLVRAGSTARADTVVHYARRAADQAFRLFAWGDAARYYEAALAAGTSTGELSDQDRATLHYLAGLAHAYDQDVGPCLHHYDQAIEAYRALGVDGVTWSSMSPLTRRSASRSRRPRGNRWPGRRAGLRRCLHP